MTTVPAQLRFTRGIFGIMGKTKTGKSSLALTAPRPVFWIDLDGSLVRALPRFTGTYKLLPRNHKPTAQDLEGADLVAVSYDPPIEWPGKKTTGFLALEQTLDNLFQLLAGTKVISSVVIDTGTLLWPIVTQAHLERLQQRDPDRSQLQQREYGIPNSRMQAYISVLYNSSKNVLITHHMTDVREKKLVNGKEVEVKVGETYDGWRRAENFVDVLVQTDTQQRPVLVNGKTELRNLPFMSIIKCGWTLDAEGKRLDDFSIPGLINYLNALRGL